MHRTLKGLAALAMMATTASVAQAQGGLGFGLHAGAALPMGDFGDVAGTGFQVGGELGFNPAALPVGVRIDVDFNRFGIDVEGLDVDGHFQALSGTANALLKIPATAISPYLVGGLGLYNMKVDVEGESESETKFGIQVGGGLQFNLSGMATHLEAKYVNVFFEGESGAYIPITFGIMFGGAGGTANARRVR